MEKKSNESAPAQGIVASRKAADDFIRAGRRRARMDTDGFSLHNRFSKMSDEDFDKAVADGTITPDQIRSAGQYAFETWRDDVWSETDAAEEQKDPTYEEFMSDPSKYGYNEYPDDEFPNRMYRYQRDYRQRTPKDNTAVGKHPVPEGPKQ